MTLLAQTAETAKAAQDLLTAKEVVPYLQATVALLILVVIPTLLGLIRHFYNGQRDAEKQLDVERQAVSDERKATIVQQAALLKDLATKGAEHHG